MLAICSASLRVYSLVLAVEVDGAPDGDGALLEAVLGQAVRAVAVHQPEVAYRAEVSLVARRHI